MHLPQGMKVESMSFGMMRFGAPSLMGVLGEIESGERAAVIGYEWPEVFGLSDTSEELESLHVRRFEADLRFGGATVPISDLRRGPDPPDFVARSNGSEVGVDVTQFVLQERALANAAFRRLRSTVLLRPKAHFKHLAGHVVYVAFDQASAGLGPKGESDIDRIAEAIEHFTPPREASLWTELPTKLPSNMTARFEGGSISAAPLTSAPTGSFYGAMGFELTLSYTTLLRQSDAWGALQRLVLRHDKPGIDVIIVPAGAPVLGGTAFPSDAVAARLALDAARTASLDAKSISSVFVHIWSTRAICSLEPGKPGYTKLTGDLPGGHEGE